MSGLPDFMLRPAAAAPVHEPANDDASEGTVEGVFVPASVPAPPLKARPPFREGVFDNLPGDLYYPVDAIGSGALKLLAQKSAGHYRVECDAPSQRTAAMQFGIAVQIGVLEPDTFASRVRAMPTGLNMRRPSDRAIAAEFYAEAAKTDAVALSRPDFDRCLRTCAAIRAHPGAQRLMRGAIFERSLFWTDAKFGVPCRARWDIFNETPHGAIVSDIKTCTDAGPEEFGRQCARMLYHAQSGHYVSGGQHLLPDVPIASFVFIAAESEEPHAVACYRVDDAAMSAGMHIADVAYSRYRDAMQSGRWGFYPDTIETLTLPRWALRF